MKIPPPTTATPGISKAEAKAPRSAEQPTTPAPQDNVRLSALSVQVRALEADLADIPVVDHARVAALREAIARGEYTVDAAKVADALIASAGELLRPGK
jgi:negative regulator of flagellin synthesis FlgM